MHAVWRVLNFHEWLNYNNIYSSDTMYMCMVTHFWTLALQNHYVRRPQFALYTHNSSKKMRIAPYSTYEKAAFLHVTSRQAKELCGIGRPCAGREKKACLVTRWLTAYCYSSPILSRRPIKDYMSELLNANMLKTAKHCT